MTSSPRCTLPLSIALIAGCTTPIPDSLHVAADTGGLAVPTGVCADRNARIGAAPAERIELELSCAAPGADGRVRSCAAATLQIRFSDGAMSFLSGLSEILIDIDLPDSEDGRAFITVVPLGDYGLLSDNLHPEIRIDVPVHLSQRSLQVVDEEQPDSCANTEGCGLMGMGAVLPDSNQPAQHYPLGTAASGVLLLDGIGWDEDPVVLELEVPFFAPDGEEAMTCTDGLIHYVRTR